MDKEVLVRILTDLISNIENSFDVGDELTITSGEYEGSLRIRSRTVTLSTYTHRHIADALVIAGTVLPGPSTSSNRQLQEYLELLDMVLPNLIDARLIEGEDLLRKTRQQLVLQYMTENGIAPEITVCFPENGHAEG